MKKRSHLARFRRQRDARHGVAEKITRETQFRKQKKIGALARCLPHCVFIQRQVGRNVAEFGVDLGNGDTNRHESDSIFPLSEENFYEPNIGFGSLAI